MPEERTCIRCRRPVATANGELCASCLSRARGNSGRASGRKAAKARHPWRWAFPNRETPIAAPVEVEKEGSALPRAAI